MADMSAGYVIGATPFARAPAASAAWSSRR